VSTFLSGMAVGNWTIDADFMRRDDVRTIFSVYRIWQQEGRIPTAACRREVADAMQVVERPLRRPESMKHCHEVRVSALPHPEAC
jgi:hypothetical protein